MIEVGIGKSTITFKSNLSKLLRVSAFKKVNEIIVLF